MRWATRSGLWRRVLVLGQRLVVCSVYVFNLHNKCRRLAASRFSEALDPQAGPRATGGGAKHGAFWTNCVRWSPCRGSRDKTARERRSRANDRYTSLGAHFDGRESSSRLLVARRFEGRGLLINMSRGCCQTVQLAQAAASAQTPPPAAEQQVAGAAARAAGGGR